MTVFTLGDVTIGGALGYAEHIDPITGTRIQHIHMTDDLGRDMVVNGMTFDRQGNLYSALGVPGGSPYEPHDIVWIPTNAGLLVIVDTDGTETGVELWKYAMDATTVLATYSVEVDAGWTPKKRLKLDVACDGHTVYYTDQSRTIFKYDIAGSGTQLTPFDVLTDDIYSYCAFKLLNGDGPDILIVAMSNAGNGPRRALCLDKNKLYNWRDEINPPGDYHVFKQQRSDGADVLSHVVSLDPGDANDKIWSLACWTNPCPGRRFSFVHTAA